MTQSVIATSQAPAPIGPYSQAVRAGNTVYVSGVIGLDPQSGQMLEGLEAQAKRVFESLAAIAAACGGSLANVVKLTIYLTDRGSEFKGGFALTCGQLGIRHTRTKPRHAFTNGFVERLQQTILHDHWRIEFRRRYFTRLHQLDHSLQSYLRFYNFERAHHGYRTQGRSPAQLVWGARDAKP